MPSQVTCDLPWPGPVLSIDKGLKNSGGLRAPKRKKLMTPEPLESDRTIEGEVGVVSIGLSFQAV